MLVVDDDETARRFLVRAIERGGLDASSVASGVEALARIAEEPPDVVLLDSQMPEMSGDDVLVALRNDPVTAELPVIVVTGRGDVDRGDEDRLGADDLVTKPVHPDELLSRVRAQLADAGDPPPSAA